MTRPLRLFEGYGIEIEYMIVDRETLAVRPLSDEILAAVAGEVVSEVECGDLAWSNELVLHVIELKTNGPAAALEGLPELFLEDVRRIDGLLEPHGARLLGSAMHPFMDPETETRLWPHEFGAVYETFHRIFDCRGHGWANLQSLHLNLPFGDDSEFGRLHSGIRFLLPLLPALAASSPFVDGRATGLMDSRLDCYRRNCARVPSVTGQVVPEPAATRAAYEADILERVYRDLRKLDPEGVIRHEWVNARGAIARFDRQAIEIRVLDVQECPAADLAIAAAIRAALAGLIDGTLADPVSFERWPVDRLVRILDETIREADRAMIEDADYLRTLGLSAGPHEARDVWRHLLDISMSARSTSASAWRPTLDRLLDAGPLSRRLLAACGPEPSRETLRSVYREVADCLVTGGLFRA
jgi:glutamate---cysteine ligase / carboxylate-amine ligase